MKRITDFSKFSFYLKKKKLLYQSIQFHNKLLYSFKNIIDYRKIRYNKIL